MELFEKAKLSDIASVEQAWFFLCFQCLPLTMLSKCCATGVTAEGKVPKGLVEEMVPLLDSRDVV